MASRIDEQSLLEIVECFTTEDLADLIYHNEKKKVYVQLHEWEKASCKRDRVKYILSKYQYLIPDSYKDSSKDLADLSVPIIDIAKSILRKRKINKLIEND